jgi:diketogulonate reductase-like aldo/keto reductase
MNYKELGQTSILLPEIGLGTWEFKGSVDALRAGIDAGAWWIDTAESYGTEDVVAQVIRNIRDRVFIATKVSPNHFRRRDLLQAADNSLRRLGVEYIDLYQLHYPNYVVPIEETMSAMEQLVDTGKVRFIGLSNFSLSELSRAQAAMSKYRIVSNQVRYNLLDRGIEHGLLAYCQQHRIAVIAYSPLARGLSNLHKKDRYGALSKVATETGKTEAQVALNWCISKPGVFAIPKADSIKHVVENRQASGWSLSPAQIRQLETGIRHKGRVELAFRRIVRRTQLTMRYR